MISSDVLDTAAADPASPAWDRIWQDSCHQGNCDPASAALLPWLARTCAAFAPLDREQPVVLAGFIAVDADDSARTAYAEAIAALRALAVAGLQGASGDDVFVYLQQAVLGFDGDEVWGKELDHLNDGEIDVTCPHCGDETLVDLQPGRSPVERGLSSALAVRLHAEAVHAGREFVAATLTHLFGRLSCPSCGTPFDLADHVAS